MRAVLPTLLFAAFLAAPAAAQVDLSKSVAEPYLRIQTSLVADSLESVNADAARIANAARKLGPNSKAIRTIATELAGVEDIAAARTVFGKLSDALIEFAEKEQATFGEDLHVAYCPMVKMSWIQKGTEIANPYGGQKMPKCGEIVKPLQ
jgi:Protein of unknown function (DUF3347)